MSSKTLAVLLGGCLACAVLVAGYVGRFLPGRLMPATQQGTLEPGNEPRKDAEAPVGATRQPEASQAALAPGSDTSAAASAKAVPQFDVVRVEPSGEAVVAGRGQPGSKVALLAGGKVLAEGSTDAQGNFVLLPPTLDAGDYALSLRVTASGGVAQDSSQSVTVSVPQKGKGPVVVALAEPGKPTVLLADPTSGSGVPVEAGAAPPGTTPGVSGPAAPHPAGTPPVAVKTAEVEEGGGFFATGTATPGARVRLYLNGTVLTDVAAGADGHWSVRVGKGVTAGRYAVRADSIDASGKVLARAEVPFEVPVEMSPVKPASPKSSSDTTQEAGATANATPGAGPETNAVIPEILTARVLRGDNLWAISRKIFGRGIRYTQIYAANTSQIRNPRLIYPGQVFVLPSQKD